MSSSLTFPSSSLSSPTSLVNLRCHSPIFTNFSINPLYFFLSPSSFTVQGNMKYLILLSPPLPIFPPLPPLYPFPPLLPPLLLVVIFLFSFESFLGIFLLSLPSSLSSFVSVFFFLSSFSLSTSFVISLPFSFTVSVSLKSTSDTSSSNSFKNSILYSTC